jgi:hypothetical protein
MTFDLNKPWDAWGTLTMTYDAEFGILRDVQLLVDRLDYQCCALSPFGLSRVLRDLIYCAIDLVLCWLLFTLLSIFMVAA